MAVRRGGIGARHPVNPVRGYVSSAPAVVRRWVESRNHHGDFLPEDQIAMALLAADCDQALDTLMTAVRRHTGGPGRDDIALLLLEYGAYPHDSTNGHPGTGRCQDASVPSEFPA